jgi:GTP-binding protein
MVKPLVAIVGRQNVGKSALFNRIVGRRLAIVEDLPGTTRDRLYGDALWQGRDFILVDTGGLVLDSRDDLLVQVLHQARQAMADADVIVFVTDVVVGLTPSDQDIANLLRRTRKPIIVAANKADTIRRDQLAVDFYSLGLGDIYPISAIHGTGVAELLDAIVAAFPTEDEGQTDEEGVRIAIVGRTNVGKSSLLNALLRQERAIVSPVAGTTRDATDTPLKWHGQSIVLVDTAGIRKRGSVEPGVEKYSVLRTIKALERAEVALLVLDGDEGIVAQDAHIASYVLEGSKSLVLVVNKWDLVAKDSSTMSDYVRYIRQQFNFVPYAPVLFISALTRQRVDQVLETAVRVYQQRHQRIPTGELNDLVRDSIARHSPPSRAGKKLRFFYATQPAVDPPTLVFFINDSRLVHFSYQRYLENRIRERWGFEGTPLVLRFRGHRSRRGR